MIKMPNISLTSDRRSSIASFVFNHLMVDGCEREAFCKIIVEESNSA